jgi:hypothetical protein
MKKLIKKGDFIMFDNPLKIVLNDILIPFGIEKQYNDYVCKLSLNNENYKMFKNIEDDIIEKLIDIDSDYELKTQINKYKQFKSLSCKLYLVKNKIVTEIIDKDSNIIGIDEIIKKDKINVILNTDRLWIKDNIAYYKWKIVFIKKN